MKCCIFLFGSWSKTPGSQHCFLAITLISCGVQNVVVIKSAETCKSKKDSLMFVKHWLLPQEACPTVSAVPERILSRSEHRCYGLNVNVRLSVTESTPTNSFFENAAIVRVIANATRVSMLLVIFVNNHDVAGDHVWCTCVPRSITIVTGIPQYISFKVRYLSYIVSLDPWTFRVRLPGQTIFSIWPKKFRVNWGHVYMQHKRTVC